MLFDNDFCYIQEKNSKELGKLVKGMYYRSIYNVSINIWHVRLRHMSTDKVRNIMSDVFCSICPLAKKRKLSFVNSYKYYISIT